MKRCWTYRTGLLAAIFWTVSPVAGGAASKESQPNVSSNAGSTVDESVAQEGKTAAGQPNANQSNKVNVATPDPTPFTEAEQRILNALDRTVSFDFQETPLIDGIDFLREYTGINIIVDKSGLDQQMISPETPLTLSMHEVRLADALALLLRPFKLRAVIHHQVLLITSRDEAMEMLQVRVFPVDDLVLSGDKSNDALQVEHLISLIQQTIHPESWESEDGMGRIGFHLGSYSLVVNQHFAVHCELVKLLEQLRSNRTSLLAENPDLKSVEGECLKALVGAAKQKEKRPPSQAEANSVLQRKANAELRLLELQAERLQQEINSLRGVEGGDKGTAPKGGKTD